MAWVYPSLKETDKHAVQGQPLSEMLLPALSRDSTLKGQNSLRKSARCFLFERPRQGRPTLRDLVYTAKRSEVKIVTVAAKWRTKSTLCFHFSYGFRQAIKKGIHQSLAVSGSFDVHRWLYYWFSQ